MMRGERACRCAGAGGEQDLRGRVAVEIVAVRCKGRRVGRHLRGQVVALVQAVLLVVAGARRVGALADEHLSRIVSYEKDSYDVLLERTPPSSRFTTPAAGRAEMDTAVARRPVNAARSCMAFGVRRGLMNNW